MTPLSYGNAPGHKKDRGGLRGKKAQRQPGDANTNEYRRAIHYACDKAFPAPDGCQGEALKKWQSDHRWSPNRLRHSRGTEIRKEFGLEAAQVFLGHSAADVTQVYAERDEQKPITIFQYVRATCVWQSAKCLPNLAHQKVCQRGMRLKKMNQRQAK